MYIKQVQLENIRSFSRLTWEIEDNEAAGWHVILGDNGAGKSAFVRSVALALVGPEAYTLLQNWASWLRVNEYKGSIKVNLIRDELVDAISPAMSPNTDNPLNEQASDKVYEFPSVIMKLRRGL